MINAQLVAERLFRKAFHSADDRQALIDTRAKSIAEGLQLTVLTNDSDALEVADGILCRLADEAMADQIRAALLGDGERLIGLVLKEYNAAAQRIAEERAEVIVDAMTPEDFGPGN
jgi:hypothetical protein